MICLILYSGTDFCVAYTPLHFQSLGAWCVLRVPIECCISHGVQNYIISTLLSMVLKTTSLYVSAPNAGITLNAGVLSH